MVSNSTAGRGLVWCHLKGTSSVELSADCVAAPGSLLLQAAWWEFWPHCFVHHTCAPTQKLSLELWMKDTHLKLFFKCLCYLKVWALLNHSLLNRSHSIGSGPCPFTWSLTWLVGLISCRSCLPSLYPELWWISCSSLCFCLCNSVSCPVCAIGHWHPYWLIKTHLGTRTF